MPEMPIDPEFGRFIDGLQENPDGSAIVDVDMEEAEIEELPDGSAMVNLEPYKSPTDDTDFYENLAEKFDSFDLDRLATRYLEFIEKDKEARKERDKQYEDGLKRTGMGNDAPGGANFNGASKVVHPIMAEACVDFAARAIKEMFPPDGPTKTKILGEVDDTKLEVAERKRDWMNWQLTQQIEEFRDEQEQLLTQLPLGGSQYMKLYYDEKKRRPCAEFIPIDNLILPFAATNFYTAQRASEKQDITSWEFNQRVSRGLYKDVNLIPATSEPDMSLSEKANLKIEGKEWDDNEDGLRTVYHIYTWLSFDDDPYTDGESAPYILMIDELDSTVLGLYRNWEEGDDAMDKLDWIVEFKFIPWRGAYAIGLPHLIGGLSAALTGALRALLDTAHINNTAAMVKLKGAKISGQSQQIEVTQVTEIEAAPGVDDIRKVAMPLPFNPPSPVLFQLLGWLDNAAKGVVTTAEEKIADITSNTPVGTTQALIEQGSAVFSSIHARLHESQKRVLMILGRLNRWYLDEQKKGDVVADLPIKREDFRRNSDVVPVSDPHIFSETQRIAQLQAVMQMAEKFPAMFDMKQVVSRLLKQLKVPNVNELMPMAAKPIEMNAADENAAMSLGRPAFAYPRQEHLAHIQTHLNFALDPVFGMNPMISPVLIPQMLEHIKQHMMLWYTNQMNTYVAPPGSGMVLGDYQSSKLASEIDRAMAVASDHVKLDSQETFSGVVQALQQLSQTMMQLQQQQVQMQQQMVVDPAAQAVLQSSMAETQRKAQEDMADLQFRVAKLQSDVSEKDKDRQVKVAMNAENNLTQERIKTAELLADEQSLRGEQTETALRLNEAAQRGLGGQNG